MTNEAGVKKLIDLVENNEVMLFLPEVDNVEPCEVVTIAYDDNDTPTGVIIKYIDDIGCYEHEEITEEISFEEIFKQNFKVFVVNKNYEEVLL